MWQKITVEGDFGAESFIIAELKGSALKKPRNN